jgi:hypothetical protein
MHRQPSGALLSPRTYNSAYRHPAVRAQLAFRAIAPRLPYSRVSPRSPGGSVLHASAPSARRQDARWLPLQARGALAVVDLVRRNPLLCLVGALLAIAGWSWLGSSEHNPTRYVLVVDSGSTGTRM